MQDDDDNDRDDFLGPMSRRSPDRIPDQAARVERRPAVGATAAAIEARRDPDVDPIERDEIVVERRINPETDEPIHIVEEAVPWRIPREPGMPAPWRASKDASVRDRREWVALLQSEGYSRRRVVDACVQRYGISERQAYLDYEHVEKRFTELALNEKVLGARKEQNRKMLHTLRREARAVGDRKTAAFLGDKIAKLDGSYAPLKIESTTTSNIQINLKIEEWVRVLDESGLAALETVLLQLSEKAPHLLPETTSTESPDDDMVGNHEQEPIDVEATAVPRRATFDE